MPRVRLYPVTPALRDAIAELVDESGIKGHRSLAHRTGGQVSYETVRRILMGRSGHIRHATLDALADALQVPMGNLIALSLGAEGDTPWRPRDEFDALPVELRPGIERALLALFRESRILPHADRI